MGEGPEFLCVEGAHGDSGGPLGRPRIAVPGPSCPSYCIPAGLPASRSRDPRTGAPAPLKTEAAQGGPPLLCLWVLRLCPGATRPATPEPLDAPAKRAVPTLLSHLPSGARALAEGDAWGRRPFLPPLPSSLSAWNSCLSRTFWPGEAGTLRSRRLLNWRSGI